MMKKSVFAIALIALMILGVVPAHAQTVSDYPAYLVSVTDKDDLLTAADEVRVNEALLAATEAAGVPVCAYVFASEIGYDGHVEYFGEDFLAEHGLSQNTDLILLVVAVTYFEVYYDLYLYGDAWNRINQKERDYILDDSRVYNNLKNARFADGLCAYASVSAEAYTGRLGVSWKLILIVALIVGAVAGWLSVKSIAASYKKKNPSQSYPLDRFAKLELTRERDREIGKFVTTTIISTGGHGGRGGSGRGGGSGHAGGR